jgi:hypothetical protein
MLKEKLKTCLEDNLIFPEIYQLKQRGIADKIEQSCNDIITKYFENVSPSSGPKSIEDISVGNNYVDHKTSDMARGFKMPNLTSIAKLKILDRPLIYNIIIYDSSVQKIKDIIIMDVFELNWDYLKIQNLGKGQLQISNMVDFLNTPKSNLSEEEWMSRLKIEAIEFYKKVQRDAEKRQKEWEASLP